MKTKADRARVLKDITSVLTRFFPLVRCVVPRVPSFVPALRFVGQGLVRSLVLDSPSMSGVVVKANLGPIQMGGR